MNRAILTINFNGALCANARASMQASAARWGAAFWEINETTDWRQPTAPNAYKCAAFARSEYEEILILDADVIVSARTPDPFYHFPWFIDPATGAFAPERTPLIAVANGSARFGDLWQVKAAEVNEVNILAARDPRFAGLPYRADTYFNTGMLLARRAAHAEMFALALEVCHVDHGLGWCDQTPLNRAAIKLGVPVQLVDERWNYIHGYTLGEGWQNMATQDVYIMHFAGETGREHTMPLVRWE